MRCLLPLLLLIAVLMPIAAAPADASGAHGLVYAVTDDGMAYGFRALPGGGLAPLKTPPTQIKPVVRTPQPDVPEQPPDTFNQQDWSSAADPNRSLLYVTGYHASLDTNYAAGTGSTGQAWGALQVYQVASDGRLMPAYKKPWSFPEALGAVTVDPKGRFVWISREEDNPKGNDYQSEGRLFIFKPGRAGMLRKVGKTVCVGTFSSILRPGDTDDSEMIISGDGKFAYVSFNEGSLDWRRDAVALYRMLPDGRLYKLAEDDSRGDACEIMSFAVNPADRFLYAADDDFLTGEAASEQVGIWARSISGHCLKAPRRIVPYPALNEWHPITLLADPNGRFLYASNNTGVQIYAINPDGALALRSRVPGLDLKAVSRDGCVLYALTTLGNKGATRTALVSARVNPDGTLTTLIPILLPKGVSVRQVLVF